MKPTETEIFDNFIRECYQRKVVNGPNIRALFTSHMLEQINKDKKHYEERVSEASDSTENDAFGENMPFTNDNTFQLVNQIGSGAFGSVAKVLNTVDGQVGNHTWSSKNQ